jgi:hypothetical protein
MRRRRPDEWVEKFKRKRVFREAGPLGRELAAWATDEVLGELAAAEPELPEGLTDRQEEIGELLVAIADMAGGDWPERVRNGLVGIFASANAAQASESRGIELLGDIRDAFARFGSRIPSVDLAAHLNSLDERSWGGWNDGKGLNPRTIAGLLRSYEIRPTTFRLADSTPKGYREVDFEDAFARHLPEKSATSATTAQPCQKQGDSVRHTDSSCCGSEEAANPHGYADVADVADSTPDRGWRHGPAGTGTAIPRSTGRPGACEEDGMPLLRCAVCEVDKAVDKVRLGITYLRCGHHLVVRPAR